MLTEATKTLIKFVCILKYQTAYLSYWQLYLFTKENTFTLV